MGALLLSGCGAPPAPDSLPVSASLPASEAPSAAPAAPAALPPPSATEGAKPPACAPKSSPVGDGAAYAFVDGVGLLRLDATSGAVSTVVAKTDGWNGALVASDDGSAWISDVDDSVLRFSGATTTKLKAHTKLGRDGFASHLAVFDGEPWAATSGIEWRVLAPQWKGLHPIAKRADFVGYFSDNKLNAIAVNKAGFWVASWNGLWRWEKKDWKKIALPNPAEHRSAAALWVAGETLVALVSREGYFQRAGDRWEGLSWPWSNALVSTVNASGLAMSAHSDSNRVVLSQLLGDERCESQSKKIPVNLVRDEALDERGRSWLASDDGILVYAADGALLRHWRRGTLPGLTGSVAAIAVSAGGPAKLPQGQPAATWALTGRLAYFKSGKPVAGATLRLCSAYAKDDCSDAQQVWTSQAGADGSFEFVGVTDGDLAIRVQLARAASECDGVFSNEPLNVTPSDACKQRGAKTCNLGKVKVCWPFEMPPPVR